MTLSGAPVWTEGQFRRTAAQDDLGLESVGAGLLRRLLPGIVQTTPNAGYYAFYPYLLAKWEENGGSDLRTDFKAFFRRQEAAYAVACVLHEHRGPLIGIQGSNRAGDVVETGASSFNLTELAEDYMESPYGGYGLFYARVLEDMRLTRAGAQRFVDRATELGKGVAGRFAEAFDDTRYYREFFAADEVPREVLEELGEATCLCAIPGCRHHQALLDIFFGEPQEDPVWESRRRTRVESLALFLEFHRQRREEVPGTLQSFRIALAQHAFQDGKPLETNFRERQNSWRAYQLRECETLVLTTIWTIYLRQLELTEPTTHPALMASLVSNVGWRDVGLDEHSSLQAARAVAQSHVATGAAIVELATDAARIPYDDPASGLAPAFLVLLAISAAAADDESGFAELRDEGGPGRWSLAQLLRWLDLRLDVPVARVLSELLDELHHQHVRVALGKVSPTDSRDPFCFSEDDGVLKLLRDDEPFWTGARFDVINHLLWTLGLIAEPSGQARLTDLGERVLAEAYRHAQSA